MAVRARVVDISAWVSGGVDRDRSRSARAIADGLAESTVVQIVGHGIPDSVVEAVPTAMDDLFALSAAEKEALIAPRGHNRGYSPSGSEALSRSLGLHPDGFDTFEAFTIGAEQADYPHTKVSGTAYAPSLWPAIPQFRRHVDTYFNEAGRVSRTLMSVLGDGLGVGRTYFNRITDHSVDTMRLVHYPGSAPSGTGMSPHTDYGFTTLVWADRLPGLQVALDGRWHDIVPEPGALLLLVGDLLAHTTNDLWPATLHRVHHTAGIDRRSVIFYHDGNAEAVIAPISGLLAPGEAARYAPVTVRDHISAKLAAGREGKNGNGRDPALGRLPDETP
ncbi:2-oxoglutarate and iron-dependent oxygenase domain-containing protein [soil metagenome]